MNFYIISKYVNFPGYLLGLTYDSLLQVNALGKVNFSKIVVFEMFNGGELIFREKRNNEVGSLNEAQFLTEKITAEYNLRFPFI